MAYIEVQHAPELRAIIRQIEQKEFAAALEALKSLQSGIDWNWYDNDDNEEKPYSQWSDQEKLDGEIYGIRNSLHMACACGNEDTHFSQRAILGIKVLIGVAGAAEKLDILDTTAAIAAEKDLEQWDATRPDGGKN
jgi:hypothetical protein